MISQHLEDLVKKLNAIEKDINDFKGSFGSWVAVPNDGGAALKAEDFIAIGKGFTK